MRQFRRMVPVPVAASPALLLVRNDHPRHRDAGLQPPHRHSFRQPFRRVASEPRRRPRLPDLSRLPRSRRRGHVKPAAAELRIAGSRSDALSSGSGARGTGPLSPLMNSRGESERPVTTAARRRRRTIHSAFRRHDSRRARLGGEDVSGATSSTAPAGSTVTATVFFRLALRRMVYGSSVPPQATAEVSVAVIGRCAPWRGPRCRRRGIPPLSASIPLARSWRLIRLRICRCRSSFCHQSTSSVNGVPPLRR